ncbi:MAG: DUF882 domain-containing protein [Alphaproteobacteria bacterium]|nr:DUF882 domain-containing protein [Alphaproteobacteria bacterium]
MNFFSQRRYTLAMLLLVFVFAPPAIHAGPEKERTISFYHIHTKETLTVTYKRAGKYVPKALKSINWLMRDWRQNTEVKIDPRTIDILWEMHTELRSNEPIHIICGYRSRKTNNLLRRTRGGQASNSLHITGKAIDAAFPDVPIRHVRYAALIRQLGGVGYYPTSAIPFVHVDTGRVRHWPRISRDELALLFTNGSSRHVPRGGRRLRPSDVKRAKARRAKLATQVAAYHTLRRQPRTPTLLADSGLIKPPKPVRVARPAPRPKPEPTRQQPPKQLASLKPQPTPAAKPWTVEVAPNTQLALATPQQSPPTAPAITFAPRRSDFDRARLNRLVAQATFVPLVEPPRLLRAVHHVPDTAKEQDRSKTANEKVARRITREIEDPGQHRQVDSTTRPPIPTATQSAESADRFDWAPGFVAVLDDGAWATAPDYDDDHPDELAYRPFPIEPILTARLDDPTLSQMTKPDNAKTLELLGATDEIPPMRLRPPQQVAQLMWRQEFSGAAVQIHGPNTKTHNQSVGDAGLDTRSVATSRE